MRHHRRIKGTGCVSGHNWPQSNQPQLPCTVIGFRAINKAAVIKSEQAPACPWHSLSLQFIHRVSNSSGPDEWIRTVVINKATHTWCVVLYIHHGQMLREQLCGRGEGGRSGRENASCRVRSHVCKCKYGVKCWQNRKPEGRRMRSSVKVNCR